MNSGANVVVQILGLLGVLILRFCVPGWVLVIAIFTLVVPALLLVPTVASIVTARKRRALPWSLGLAYLAAPVAALTAAATYPDFSDTGEYVPALVFSGAGSLDGPEAFGAVASPGFHTAGTVAALAYLACLVWIGVATNLDRRRVPQVAGA